MWSRAPAPVAALLLLALAGAGTTTATEDCYSVPSSSACAGFRVPDAEAEAFLLEACSRSGEQGGNSTYGWPSPCTLWHQCRDGRGAAALCAPVRLARSVCAVQEIGGMCSKWVITFFSFSASSLRHPMYIKQKT
jgi:hypothetical protein